MASIRSLLKYVLLNLALSSFHGAQVDPEVFQILEREGVACIIVEFGSDMVDEVVDCYERKKRSAEAGTFEDLASELMGIAKRSQARAISAIHETSRSTGKTNSRGKPSFKLYDMHQLWATNELVIRNADKTLITQLSEMPEVLSIKSDVSVPFESTECWSEDSDDSSQNGRGVENPNTTETTESTPTTEATDSTTTQFPDQKIETTTPYPLPPDRWNMIETDVYSLWRKQEFGEGVVVGIVSSGVDFFHEAVRTKHRIENGWYDPVNGIKLPYDDSTSEIGTRTASIILGGTTADGYGVAPLAKWIACRAMHNGNYTLSNLKICIQFMACPTDTRNKNPDCTLRPRVVHIALGFFYNEERPQYNVLPSIKVLKAAGTIVVWANGDAFEHCQPGFVETTDPYVISVTALDDSFYWASFSTRGFTNKTTKKALTPTVSAPGGPAIYAATSRHDKYRFDNKSRGTFVAAAHVAGIAALLVHSLPNVTAYEVKQALSLTTLKINQGNLHCDLYNDNERPNVFYGTGIAQAYRAWKHLLNVTEERNFFFYNE